jgi:hypothetical protein
MAHMSKPVLTVPSFAIIVDILANSLLYGCPARISKTWNCFVFMVYWVLFSENHRVGMKKKILCINSELLKTRPEGYTEAGF